MEQQEENLRLMLNYSRFELYAGFPIAHEKWKELKFTGFLQDTEGATLFKGTPEEVYYEPTFNWMGAITGHRQECTTETGHFYLRVRALGESGVPLNERLARAVLFAALEEFDEFLDCACTISQPCEKHKEKAHASA